MPVKHRLLHLFPRLFFHPQVLTRVTGNSSSSSSYSKQGFMHVMQFTPERWTYALPHRTQILYFYDISTVVFQLNLRPGSKVIESGTGSGSLTNALARAVAPTGHVFTFEFNAERAKKAQEEFRDLKIDDVVTAKHGDACAGFGRGRELDDTVDAVFLDLPSPWLAIPHAYAALKKASGGIICCFSPCIEQVQKNCIKLTTLGFEDLSTIEALGCEFDVATAAIPQPHVPSLFAPTASTAAVPSASSFSSSSAKPSAAATTTTKGPTAGVKRKREEGGGEADGVDFVAADGAADDEDDGAIAIPLYPAYFQGSLPLATRQNGAGVAGHTGYLTFATLYRKRLTNEEALSGKVLIEEDAVADLINRKGGKSAATGGGAAEGSKDEAGDREEED